VIKATTMLEMIQMMPRALRGTGALATAVDGHWNSSMTGVVGSFVSLSRRRPAPPAREVLVLVIDLARSALIVNPIVAG
jgi:hypothetical protein